MKSIKGLAKWLTVGALTLAISVPAGAASAAAAGGNAVTYKVYYVNAGTQIDWNALLQQYFQGYKPVVTPSKPTTPTTPTKPTTPTTPTKPTTPTTPTDTTASSYASQVVTLVNQERAKAGLKPLTTRADLANMAMAKAKDMKNNNYFDHNSPTYGSPFDMMKSWGISYRTAGENIAMGQRTPQEVMTAWMNSPGHKANILNASFTTIGVAYYQGEWVQEFIS